MTSLDEELQRRLEDVVMDRLHTTPVVVLHGPRTVGKSTLLRRLAHRFDRPIIDLDQPADREIAVTSPSFAVAGQPPVFIDEYQHAPSLLDAIKAELNVGASPGRFIITGSTSYTTIPRAAQSLTGRAEVLEVWPLSQGELDGNRETFVERLIADPANMQLGESSTTRLDYVDRVLRGGMPMATRLDSDVARRRWYASYLDLVIERDVLDISRIRQREAMPRLLRRLATQTGQLLNMAQAAAHAGLEASVGEQYTVLLEAVFMVHRIPAWRGTQGARVGSRPKIHVVDTGIGGWLLNLRRKQIERRNSTAMRRFGHLLETFAVNEILKQTSWLAEPIDVGHFRTKEGAEVDLVLEVPAEGVIGVEVKAGELHRPEDLAGLRSLRERLGDEFLGGVLLQPRRYGLRLEDRIAALPLDALWRGR